MTMRDEQASESLAGSANEAAEEATGELSTSDLLLSEAAVDINDPDEIGPTVVGIPIRNELAAARMGHAVTNVREAQALIDEAVELLATVRDLHVETYQLGAAGAAIHQTAERLGRRCREGAGGGSSPAQSLDLKKDPTYEEIALWMSFGIPVMS